MRLAARGTRHLDRQEEPLDDALAVQQLRAQSRHVQRTALLLALLLTLLLTGLFFCLGLL